MRAQWLFRPLGFRRQHRTRTQIVIATLTGVLTVPFLFCIHVESEGISEAAGLSVPRL
jgi:hypothetical protein